MSITTRQIKFIILANAPHLIQLPISTVKNELNGDVCTVFNPADICGGKVQVRAERSLSCGLEVCFTKLEVATAVLEVTEIIRILIRRDNDPHCDFWG